MEINSIDRRNLNAEDNILPFICFLVSAIHCKKGFKENEMKFIEASEWRI